MKVLPLAVFLCVLAAGASACSYDDIIGTWTITETDRVYGTFQDCQSMPKTAHLQEFTFEYPNIVMDEINNKGTWTMVGPAAVEVNINSRTFYATMGVLNCGKLVQNWARDDTMRNWSCFEGLKKTPTQVRAKSASTLPDLPEIPFVNDHSMIQKINKAQSSWTAAAYPQFEEYTVRDMFNIAGGKLGVYDLPSPAPATTLQKAKVVYLPTSFDWRNVNGVSYVSPVRNQGQCGGCYSFASTGAIEARIRILTKLKRDDIFSPQDVIDCSPLTYGCNGGWNILVAGRYGQDFGFVHESCNPYVAKTKTCSRDTSCPLTYVRDYSYVGGYYGGTNEEQMMEHLITGGPMPVVYNVYNDFYNYKDGVYKHTEIQSSKNDFDPYESVNHAVLLVGYGVEETTGEKYWIIKNSWGPRWGEAGYFRILRGVDECGVESAALNANPIP